MTIKDELLALEDKNGLIVPRVAVDWARKHKNSALHAAIEWDRDKAALEYQIWQVRRLIALHIVSKDGQRQLVSLTIDRINPGGGYRDIEAVGASLQLRQVLLEDAFRDFERMRLKYEHLQDLVKVWAEVERAKTRRKAA